MPYLCRFPLPRPRRVRTAGPLIWRLGRRRRGSRTDPTRGCLTAARPREPVPGFRQGVRVLWTFLDDQTFLDETQHRRMETFIRDPAVDGVAKQNFARPDQIQAKLIEDAALCGVHFISRCRLGYRPCFRAHTIPCSGWPGGGRASGPAPDLASQADSGRADSRSRERARTER
jgi:hypothetical protein